MGQGTTAYLTWFYCPFQHKPGTDFVRSVRNPKQQEAPYKQVTGATMPARIRTQIWFLPAAGYLHLTGNVTAFILVEILQLYNEPTSAILHTKQVFFPPNKVFLL